MQSPEALLSPADGKPMRLQGTVADLQTALHRRKKVFYPSRQRLTLPIPAGQKKPTVLAPDKRLADYGLADGSIVVFKDLGPQARFQPLLTHAADGHDDSQPLTKFNAAGRLQHGLLLGVLRPAGRVCAHLLPAAIRLLLAQVRPSGRLRRPPPPAICWLRQQPHAAGSRCRRRWCSSWRSRTGASTTPSASWRRSSCTSQRSATLPPPCSTVCALLQDRPTPVAWPLGRFSHATMPIFNLFRNCAYYWGFGAYVSYFVNHPLYTEPPHALSVPLLAFALLCQAGNFRCPSLPLLLCAGPSLHSLPGICPWSLSLQSSLGHAPSGSVS